MVNRMTVKRTVFWDFDEKLVRRQRSDWTRKFVPCLGCSHRKSTIAKRWLSNRWHKKRQAVDGLQDSSRWWRPWSNQSFRQDKAALYRGGSGMSAHTAGTRSALELVTKGVHGAVMWRDLTVSRRKPAERPRWGRTGACPWGDWKCQSALFCSNLPCWSLEHELGSAGHGEAGNFVCCKSVGAL